MTILLCLYPRPEVIIAAQIAVSGESPKAVIVGNHLENNKSDGLCDYSRNNFMKRRGLPVIIYSALAPM